MKMKVIKDKKKNKILDQQLSKMSLLKIVIMQMNILKQMFMDLVF